MMLGSSMSTFTSCDLAYDPPGYFVPDSLITTAADARATLNSAYSALRSGAFYGGQLWLLNETMADHINGNLDALPTGDVRAHYTRTTDIFLGTTRSLMSEGSKAVGRCNLLLKYIDGIADLDAAERARMKAEVKFIRAIVEFELVRMFAQPYGYSADNSHLGIPIHKVYAPDPVNRSTVAEVYADILLQLTEAANELPDMNNGYATKWAAKGYLAKVYFQMNDMQNAYDNANEVIQSGFFMFDDSLKNRFSPNGTTEAVFQMLSAPNTGPLDDNAGALLRDVFRSDPSRGGRAGAFVADAFYAQATGNANDWRAANWYAQQNIAGTNYAFCKKYPVDSAFNVPTCHITELKLIRAETAAELGDVNTAAQDLSDVRIRAGLSGVNAAQGAANLIQLCRQERELEMFMEGCRLQELKRQAVRDTPGLLIRGAIWNCPGMVCQLPDNELAGNPDMVPNPQGGCN